jgi:DNA-binding MarR family transcriptional regulator
MKCNQFNIPKQPTIKKVDIENPCGTLPPPPWVYPIGYPDSNFSWNFTPFPLAFSLMPSRAISDIRLSRNDLRILGALCTYTSPKGICYPNQETLYKNTGIARPNISRAIKRLTKFGYIRHLVSKGKKQPKSFRRGNRYQVLIRGDETLPSQKEVEKPYFSKG